MEHLSSVCGEQPLLYGLYPWPLMFGMCPGDFLTREDVCKPTVSQAHYLVLFQTSCCRQHQRWFWSYWRSSVVSTPTFSSILIGVFRRRMFASLRQSPIRNTWPRVVNSFGERVMVPGDMFNWFSLNSQGKLASLLQCYTKHRQKSWYRKIQKDRYGKPCCSPEALDRCTTLPLFRECRLPKLVALRPQCDLRFLKLQRLISKYICENTVKSAEVAPRINSPYLILRLCSPIITQRELWPSIGID